MTKKTKKTKLLSINNANYCIEIFAPNISRWRLCSIAPIDLYRLHLKLIFSIIKSKSNFKQIVSFAIICMLPVNPSFWKPKHAWVSLQHSSKSEAEENQEKHAWRKHATTKSLPFWLAICNICMSMTCNIPFATFHSIVGSIGKYIAPHFAPLAPLAPETESEDWPGRRGSPPSPSSVRSPAATSSPQRI